MSKYGGRNSVPVELYKNGEFVHWFPNQCKAAEFLDIPRSRISDAIRRGIKTCGYEIRVSETIEDTIAGFKKTYQFSR